MMVHAITWDSHTLDFTRKTYVMAILNCTPDSFYAASRKATMDSAIRTATEMINAGVDIIDVGGESSRPGAEAVSSADEADRIIPVITEIRERSDILISVDTAKSSVALRALEAGAHIINDISGLKSDPDMAPTISKNGCPVVIMHMRGSPRTLQKAPYYDDTIKEIIGELRQSIRVAVNAGIPENRIIIDPGIGFGKRLIDNLRILKNLREFEMLGMPILIGLSRKSFLGALLGVPANERLTVTIAANALAVCNGANMVRVHDYHEGVQMARLIDAIRHAE